MVLAGSESGKLKKIQFFNPQTPLVPEGGILRFFRVLIFSVISFSKVRNDLDLEEYRILDQVFLKIKTLVQNAACFPKLSLGWRNPYEGLRVPKKFICELNMNFANRKCGFISCSTINQPPPDPLGEGTQKIYPPPQSSGFRIPVLPWGWQALAIVDGKQGFPQEV